MDADAKDKADDIAAIEAIRVVRKHLQEKWVSEGCRTHPVWGCVSCRAIRLDADLEQLAAEIGEW